MCAEPSAGGSIKGREQKENRRRCSGYNANYFMTTLARVFALSLSESASATARDVGALSRAESAGALPTEGFIMG